MSLSATPSQTIGPFFHMGLDVSGTERLVSPDEPGALQIEGRLFDGDGVPISDALVEAWDGSRFGRCATDAEGRFRFVAKKPAPACSGDAPHLDMIVFARGLLDGLLTRMYFPDEEAANAADPVLGMIADPVRRSLIAEPESGRLRFDIHLQGERETVFFSVAS